MRRPGKLRYDLGQFRKILGHPMRWLLLVWPWPVRYNAGDVVPSWIEKLTPNGTHELRFMVDVLVRVKPTVVEVETLPSKGGQRVMEVRALRPEFERSEIIVCGAPTRIQWRWESSSEDANP